MRLRWDSCSRGFGGGGAPASRRELDVPVRLAAPRSVPPSPDVPSPLPREAGKEPSNHLEDTAFQKRYISPNRRSYEITRTLKPSSDFANAEFQNDTSDTSPHVTRACTELSEGRGLAERACDRRPLHMPGTTQDWERSRSGHRGSHGRPRSRGHRLPLRSRAVPPYDTRTVPSLTPVLTGANIQIKVGRS